MSGSASPQPPRRIMSKSLVLSAADSKIQPSEKTPGAIEVYECKQCDMVSKDADTTYGHLENCHCRKKPRGFGRPSNYRSFAMEGFLASSFQKTVYRPEVFLDEGGVGAPNTYTAYACTFCHYQHLNNQQVRKHGTMCHFLEIPVFSCVYCKTAVADRAVFDKHLQLKHRYKKVDFSFDCKALTLLNDFLSESIYQIHVQKAGLLEVIKDREENFIHYTDELLKDMQDEEEPEDKSDSGDSVQKTVKPDGGSSPNGKHSQTSESVAGFVNEAMGSPRNTVRYILDAMMQQKDDTKKKYLKTAVQELLKEMCEEVCGTEASNMPAEGTNDVKEGEDNGKDGDVSFGGEVVPVTLFKNDCAEKTTEDKKEKEEKMEVDLSIVKTEREDLRVVSEEKKEVNEENKVGATEEVVVKRKRGRPRLKRKLPVQDKAYRPLAPVGGSKREKGAKVVVLPGEPDTGLSPGRYNFRQRKKVKTSDEEEISEEEKEIDECKKNKLNVDKFTEVVSERQKVIAKAFQKLLPSGSESKSDEVQKSDEPKQTPLAAAASKNSTLISALSQPVPMTLSSPVITPTAPQVSKPQTYLMVNGQLIPIMQTQASGAPALNVAQPLQLVNPSAPRPPTFQTPQIIQLPTQQAQPQQQVPLRFTIQQPQQTFVLNVGQQQQQQPQIFPMMNQPIQQPQFIIQQGAGLQQPPRPIQVIPQSNATIIPAASAPQFPITIMKPGAPPIQQNTLTQTGIQNILNLGGQFVNQTQLKSEQTPFVVGATPSASGTSIVPSIPPVQPIVIKPKEDNAAVASSPKLATLLTNAEESFESISHYFIACYICRRCLQVFLTSDNLDKHVYKEELDKNPALALPFSKMKSYLGQFAITPVVTILQKGCDWDIPVYRCGECNIVHILESHINKHIQNHDKGCVKCVRESLWSPSDLRVICTRGWTSSLKMQCKAQSSWAVDYFMDVKEGFLKQRSNLKLKKALISDLEMYDTIAKADSIAQKQKATKGFKVVSSPQSISQVVCSQSGTITVQSKMQGSVAGPNPIQIIPQYVAQTRPQGSVQRLPTQIMPGARIIQIPQMSQMMQMPQQQPPSIQILPSGQPAPAQAMRIIQMPSPVAPATAGSASNLPKAVVKVRSKVETVEPDSSCQVEEDSKKTKPKSNLLLAPNILSCFSGEDEEEGSLGGKFLGKIPSGDADMADNGAGEVDESENQTGEAFVCRLCAYSCDTERRVKQHLMSSHISVNMYPFRCMSCSYESPSTLRLAQHILYKHQKQAKKNPPRLAKDMEKDKELWPKIMPDENKYKRFTQELDCLFRNCVEKC